MPMDSSVAAICAAERVKSFRQAASPQTDDAFRERVPFQQITRTYRPDAVHDGEETRERNGSFFLCQLSQSTLFD